MAFDDDSDDDDTDDNTDDDHDDDDDTDDDNDHKNDIYTDFFDFLDSFRCSEHAQIIPTSTKIRPMMMAFRI